jgi:hypothetical protein
MRRPEPMDPTVPGPWEASLEDAAGGRKGGQESSEGSSYLLSWNLLKEIIP